MQLGIFAKTFSGSTVREILAKVRATGFRTVQFNLSCAGLEPMPRVIPDETLAEIQSAFRESGLSMAAISGTFNMIHTDVGVRQTGLERLAVLARACPALGTRVITLCTGTRDQHDQWRGHPDNATPEAWHDLTHLMEQALRLAEEHDVVLAIEPETANVVSDAAKARQFLDEMQSDRLKIIFDPANLFEEAGVPQIKRLIREGLELLAKDLVLAHVKDRDAAGNFATAGQGIVPFDYFIEQLHQFGFDGPLITHGLEEREAAEVYTLLNGLMRSRT